MSTTRFSFVLWGWATLLVILVSAAPDGGAPGSRTLGSAFDPATVSVAVGPQQTRAAVAAKADEALPATMAGGVADALIPTEFASPVGAGTGPVLAPRPQTGIELRLFSRAHGARAPPLA